MSTTPDHVMVAVVQMQCSPDPAANVQKASERIREAAGAGANIVCLQELFRTQYFCQSEDHANFDLAETVPGPTTETLGAVAHEAGVMIVASLFEKRAAGVFHNTAVLIDRRGEISGKYRKMHIPDDPLYFEKFYFTPGDLGFLSWETEYGKLGICICWDQWYPEAARLTALHGAEMIFYPTAIGWHPSEKASEGRQQLDAWETMQRSHAIANGCFVASANRVGHEAPAGGDGIEFWGGSFVCDPSGEVLARAGNETDEVLLAEIDFSHLERQRTHWPFLRDRRTDAYAAIGRRMID